MRAVRLSGAPGIDPQRTALPEEWKSLPAFQLAQGAALGFTELRRDGLDVQRWNLLHT